MEPIGVPEADPAGGRQLDLVDAPPGTVAVDQLGLVQPVDGLGQGIVVLSGSGLAIRCLLDLNSLRANQRGYGRGVGLALRGDLDVEARRIVHVAASTSSTAYAGNAKPPRLAV